MIISWRWLKEGKTKTLLTLWEFIGSSFENLNPLHPGMLCTKFGWNWLSGSGEEDFFNFTNVF